MESHLAKFFACSPPAPFFFFLNNALWICPSCITLKSEAKYLGDGQTERECYPAQCHRKIIQQLESSSFIVTSLCNHDLGNYATPGQKKRFRNLSTPYAIAVTHQDFSQIIITRGALCYCEKYLCFKAPPTSI